jgi:N-acyl-D-aspartate/D-glutamate deacylase
VERRGVVLNFGCYVGHSAVRLYAMGDAGYERAAGDEEIARMRGVVAESMRAGGLGFSTSFSASHNGDGKRPVPSRCASVAEVEALASVLGELGRGVVVFAPGSPLGYAQSYALARRTGRPWMWTPMITNYPEPDYRDAMRAHAAGRAAGAEVLAQVSCRPVTVQFALSNPYLFGSAPSFNEVARLPGPERLARYRDPAWRAGAFAEIGGHVRPTPDWSQFTVAETRAHTALIGRDLASLARERGGSPLDVLVELSLAEELGTRFLVKLSNYDEKAVAEILRQPGVVLGQSDAGAHLSALCDASMPTDLLGGWVRERGVLSLERAVRMLSAELAELFGLSGRGYVREGWAADLVAFDPARVAPGPVRRVWDLPGGEDRLVADQPLGIRHILVNGTPIWCDERSRIDALETRPGRVLRSGAAA